MAKHLTKKQEGFVTEYMKHGDASKAYRTCYNCANMKAETVWQGACRLLKNSKVAARVQQLQRELSELTMVTLSNHTATVQAIMDEAREEGCYGPAISGAVLVARMHGLFEPKQNEANEQPNLTAFRMVKQFSEGAIPLPGNSSTGAEVRVVLEPGDVVTPFVH